MFSSWRSALQFEDLSGAETLGVVTQHSNVPLESYWFCCEAVRKVWGHGINLRPMGKLLRPTRP